MKGYLHLILQIEVSARQESEQRWQVNGKLTPQISLEKTQVQVEVRVLWYRLRAPLPAGVSHVIGFRFGFAPKRPGGAEAFVVMGM